MGLAPAAPNVTADDTANTITGLTKDMEYSIDNGTTYKKYDGSVVPTFPGEQKVLVRTAKTDKKKESKTKEILFTADTTTPNTAPEQDNLTLDEHLKRNAAITKSIQDATAFPIAIDYGPDKANLEAK